MKDYKFSWICKREPKMTEEQNQSGAELRMQGGGIGSETWKRGPRFPQEGGWTQKSVLVEKIAHRTRKPGIVLVDFHGNLIIKNLPRFCDSKRQKSSGQRCHASRKIHFKIKEYIFQKSWTGFFKA